MVHDHTETDPKRPIDWLKVTLIVIVFSLVLTAAIWELKLS